MKKLKGRNIRYAVKSDLCLGCGLCVDSCPTKSISMSIVNGEYRPIVTEYSCNKSKGCSRCISICPGLGIELHKVGNELFASSNSINYNRLIGYYKEGFSGYAINNEIRLHGASGGVLTAFLSFLLDKKYVSSVVVVDNDISQPFMSKVILAHSSSDLFNTRSSKYCPVKYDSIVNAIKSEASMSVIVGLPCIIHGFRKYEKVDPIFRKLILGYFGLYCSCNRSFNLTSYIFKKYNIKKEDISYFQYRDNGCLGNLTVLGNNININIPFELYYHPLRSFFIPNRCQLCVDHYSELADVSFGDIHFGIFKKDKIGVNSIVVRNDKFHDLLVEAKKSGYIQIEEITEDILVKCQASAPKKKGRVGKILKTRHLLGLRNPQYDISYNKYSWLSAIVYYTFVRFQMMIGKRKWLWWIIPFLTRKGHIS